MITFCLMSCGELTERECLAAVQPFRNLVVLQEVRNVTPQIKALNQMLNQVSTPYLVPLDADIVLNSDAYQRIEQAIQKHQETPGWHSILFRLYDVLTEENILALKVLRTDVMKRYLFEDGPTPDVAHFQTLTEAGYSCITEYLSQPPIGRHVVKGRHFCYHKYRDVYQTLRTYNRAWDQAVFKGGETILEKSKAHFDYFVYRWATTGEQDFLWCVAGMLDGLTLPLGKSKSLAVKDYTTTAERAAGAYLDWYANQQMLLTIL